MRVQGFKISPAVHDSIVHGRHVVDVLRVQQLCSRETLFNKESRLGESFLKFIESFDVMVQLARGQKFPNMSLGEGYGVAGFGSQVWVPAPR